MSDAPLGHANDGAGNALCGKQMRGEFVVGTSMDTPVTCAGCIKLQRRSLNRARKRHDDGGPTLPEAAMPVVKAYIDADAWLGQAIVRLGNLLQEHPELEERDLGVRLAALKAVRKELKADQPLAPCVFCAGAGEKAACNVCRGTRWINRAELEAAPAEVRAKAWL